MDAIKANKISRRKLIKLIIYAVFFTINIGILAALGYTFLANQKFNQNIILNNNAIQHKIIQLIADNKQILSHNVRQEQLIKAINLQSSIASIPIPLRSISQVHDHIPSIKINLGVVSACLVIIFLFTYMILRLFDKLNYLPVFYNRWLLRKNVKCVHLIKKFQLQLEDKQFEQALVMLRYIQKQASHLISSKHLLVDLERSIHLQLLRQIIHNNSVTEIRNFMQSLPRPWSYDQILLADYCKYLIVANQHELAERILRGSISREFNEFLIGIYSNIDRKYIRYIFIENLLIRHDHSAALLRCLGKLNLTNNLWGKAKGYLCKSLEIEKHPETYVQLGRLYESLNDPAQACTHYREAFRLGLRLSL